MFILSSSPDLANPAIIAALIAATVSILLAYLKPFSDRRNSEVSTLHSESVWREKLFELATLPADEVGLKQVELFRTFLSATRGVGGFDVTQDNPMNDVPYDPNAKNSDNRDLDDLCLIHYQTMRKDLKGKEQRNHASAQQKQRNQASAHVSLENAEVMRQLCRLLLKSDWNRRIHDENFVETEIEINMKALAILGNIDDSATVPDLLKEQGFSEICAQTTSVPEDLPAIAPKVVKRLQKTSYPWAFTKLLLKVIVLIGVVYFWKDANVRPTFNLKNFETYLALLGTALATVVILCLLCTNLVEEVADFNSKIKGLITDIHRTDWKSAFKYAFKK